MSSNSVPLNQDGQILAIGALVMVGVLAIVLAFISLAGLYANISHLQNTADYAAEIAARPSGTTMSAGDLAIDVVTAKKIARAEVIRSLSTLKQLDIDVPVSEFVDSAAVTIDVVNPPLAPPNCATLPGGTKCFSEPVVRVKITAPVKFWLINASMDVTREGVATTGSSKTGEEQLPVLEVPTQVALPTVQITATPPSAINAAAGVANALSGVNVVVTPTVESVEVEVMSSPLDSMIVTVVSP